MTVLPSIMSTPTLGPGQVFHSERSHLPHRSHSLGCTQAHAYGRTPGPRVLGSRTRLPQHTAPARLRTNWLPKNLIPIGGEIRNMQVLGIISGRLVVAYQGQGKLRVFLDNQHSLELEEIQGSEEAGGHGGTLLPDSKALGRSKGGGRDYRKYLPAHSEFRCAEFQAPPVPATVLVLGETEASAVSADATGPPRRPTLEARLKAKVTVSGHVTSSQYFPSCSAGAAKPSYAPAAGPTVPDSFMSTLCASQKIFSSGL
mmetsp:Transcript_32290/g.85257  ORF Transcript_32290/g.85257 Transcript_32290/m.85257 type:complete len:257 (-) Transcript_32290:185-955(-)